MFKPAPLALFLLLAPAAFAQGPTKGKANGTCETKRTPPKGGAAEWLACVEYTHLNDQMLSAMKATCGMLNGQATADGKMSSEWKATGACPPAGRAGACALDTPAFEMKTSYYKSPLVKDPKAACDAMKGKWTAG